MRRGPHDGNRRPRPAPEREAPAAPGTPRLVLGLQPVRELLRARGGEVGAVLVGPGRGEAGPRLDALARFAEAQGVGVERVELARLDRLAAGERHQGAAAWAPPLRLAAPSDLLSDPALLALLLDGVQDPQNFGAAVRSAVALGATGVVWAEHASAPLTPATFRASAGAIEHATLCRVGSLVRFVDDARAAGARVVGLAPEAEPLLHQVDLSGPLVIVVGSEQEGLGRAVRRHCDLLARLAQRGPVESLNASVAAALALYTATLQRGTGAAAPAVPAPGG